MKTQNRMNQMTKINPEATFSGCPSLKHSELDLICVTDNYNPEATFSRCPSLKHSELDLIKNFK